MNDLNLVPRHIKEKRYKNNFIRTTVAVLVIVLVVLILSIYIPNLLLDNKASSINEIKQHIDKNQYLLEDNKRVEVEVNGLRTYVDKVDALTKKKLLASDVFSELSTLVPKDVVIQSLSFQGSISISAKSTNYYSIAEFGANLQTYTPSKDVKVANIDYKNAKIANISGDKAGGSYTFSITIPFKEGAGNGQAK